MNSRFPLVIQLPMPEDFTGDVFAKVLRTLQQHGFYGVELHVTDAACTDASLLKKLLTSYELHLTRIATGRLALTQGLSLSSADKELRERSIKALEPQMELAAQFECGIILGSIKGKPSGDTSQAGRYLTDCLAKLEPYAQRCGSTIVLEATNRYEATAATTLQSAAEILDELNNPKIFRLLPDTFHMNIEETDMCAALAKYADYYDSVHISDNNRFYPGYGAIHFTAVYHLLDSIGFTGYTGIEGNIRSNLSDDLAVSVSLIRQISSAF